MKFKFTSLLTALCAVILFSCGPEKVEDKPAVAPEGMKFLSLAHSGMNIQVAIPDNPKFQIDTVKSADDAYVINVGPTFGIVVKEDAGDIADLKTMINGDEVYKVKKTLIDDATTLMWESGIEGMQSQFHFYTIIKLGARSYVIKDNVSSSEPFNEESIKKMYEAAKASAEVKKTPEA